MMTIVDSAALILNALGWPYAQTGSEGVSRRPLAQSTQLAGTCL